MEERRIYQNAIIIDEEVILRSAHRHDYRKYDGFVVDGGTSYIRRSYPSTEDYKNRYRDLMIYYDHTLLESIDKMTMRVSPGSNDWMFIRDAEDDKLMTFYEYICEESYMRPVDLIAIHDILTSRGHDLECPLEYDLGDTIGEIIERYPIPKSRLNELKKQKMDRIMMHLSELEKEDMEREKQEPQDQIITEDE